MSVNLPVNLTAAFLGASETPDSLSASSVLLRPDARCDRVNGPWLQAQGQAAATQHEVYVVAAGHGGLRCEDGSLIDVTAGDLVYVAPGTRRGFEALSRKFSAFRLSFPAMKLVTDPG